jgi:hypothetical protein
MKKKFYTFPRSQFTVNIDHVVTVGFFTTYTDSSKTESVQKYMIKLRIPVKNGHPYTHEITEREIQEFHQFLEEQELL